MESFSIAVKAVWPFLCYMLVGYLVRRSGKADEAFFRRLNQVAFVTFFPLNIFYSIYTMSTEDTLSLRFLGLVFIVEIVVVCLLLVIVPRLIKDRKKIPVVIQAIFRSNIQFFAIPLAASVFGTEASKQASMLLAIVLPFYNVVSVLLLSFYAGDSRPSAKGIVLQLAKNPIILGLVTGVLLRLLPFTLPDTFLSPINTLGNAATPVSVMVLGGTLTLASVRTSAKYLTFGLAGRFLVIPLLLLGLSFVLQLSGFERFILLMLFITPVASSSFPMAVNMGADGDLAGNFVAVSTLASLVVVFLWIFTLSSFGWL